ncbi:hypothetical protein [Paracerasibacillus soli]|uniref:5'-nucleotidase n=1 Tax=Paracerasibacillus soli TaxID=480284 RepID=A0ABU5CX03_9BACI|nr:hypothetical protein [Virgibacillus soli]MDY0410411.1 hypothetical protein [Virgibacillus soli]
MKSRKRFGLFSNVTAITMLVMSLILPSFAFAEGGNESVSDDSFALTLMHFNDSHAHVEGYPKMITAIKEIRQEDQMHYY